MRPRPSFFDNIHSNQRFLSMTKAENLKPVLSSKGWMHGELEAGARPGSTANARSEGGKADEGRDKILPDTGSSLEASTTLTTTTTMAAHSAMEKLHAMVATSAIYDGERDEKDDYTRVCHPGTREDHLRDLATWANNAPPATRVEWHNAIAGAGKTAMLRTFCTELEEQSGIPPVSFFVWKGDARRNTLKHFPATIAYQLCQVFQVIVPHIEKAMKAAPLLLQSAFKKQMDKLVIGPLLDACDAIKEERHLIIVVDGLDELDAEGQTVFLNFIPYFLSRLASLPISLLVSSRPEEMIVGAFEHPKLASVTRATRLGASDEDILKFLNDKLDDINLRFPYLRITYGGKWPSDEQRAIMVRQSSGLFIWPTVAINYIDKVALGLGHNKRLEQVLSSAEPKPWIASPLDNLYRAILQAHAPEDPEDLLRFNQRLAYLCLPVGIGMFVRGVNGQAIDWTNIPARALFEETLDELWGSVTGLSSLFSPRTTFTTDESPTPGISHLSLRDFTFNRARCGDKFYYSSEQQLHAEVVCKFLKFFNTRKAYQSCAEMSAQFIRRAGNFLESHLKEAAVSEELGRCMDDVMMDYISPTWPLVTQIFAIVRLFDGLYELADNPEFPDGSQRRKAFLSKVVVFFENRVANAEGWDITLLRLAFSTADFESVTASYHSVHCWHVHRSAQCACLDAWIRNIPFDNYQRVLRESTLFQHVKSRLLPDGQDDIAKDTLDVLQFIIPLSETSPQAIHLSSFIHVRIDYWIIGLLKHCPPNDVLYNTLGHICTAPLTDLQKRGGDDSWELAKQFLRQTETFNGYAKRCREAGIETKFPPIEFPEDWWGDLATRNMFLEHGYKPPFDVPDDWWKDEHTRNVLLDQGHKPPFDIPDKWWSHEDTRRLLRRRCYPPPDPYSAEETAGEPGSDSSEDEEPAAQDEAASDHFVTGEDEPLTGGEASSGIASPQVPPSSDATSSNPLPIQQTVASAHPMITPAVGAENGQVVLSTVGGRRRRLWDSLKNLFRR